MLSFRADTPKNKKISINKVAYGSDHIFLVRDSTLPNILNFCFYLFHCNRREKGHNRRKINSKNKIFMREISIIIIFI